jgi:hypothetical protein
MTSLYEFLNHPRSGGDRLNRPRAPVNPFRNELHQVIYNDLFLFLLAAFLIYLLITFCFGGYVTFFTVLLIRFTLLGGPGQRTTAAVFAFLCEFSATFFFHLFFTSHFKPSYSLDQGLIKSMGRWSNLPANKSPGDPDNILIVNFLELTASYPEPTIPVSVDVTSRVEQ